MTIRTQLQKVLTLVLFLAVPAISAQAQRTLSLTTPVGGEKWSLGLHEIRWTQGGTGWNGTDTLRIEYSDDAGGSWTQITDTVAASDLIHMWNATGLSASLFYQVRLTCIQEPVATVYEHCLPHGRDNLLRKRHFDCR